MFRYQGRRANALISVMAISAVLFILCFVIASMSLADLDFASSYRAHVQDEQLARAAIAQFTYENDQATVNNSPLESSPATDWAARYANQPVFPTGSSHLPGTVAITFNTSNPYWSFDNSQSSLPAAGWMDRGRSTKSVPPYSVDLLLQVQTGSQPSVFEAVVQRRWPYVLTSPGPIRVLGTFGSPLSGALSYSPFQGTLQQSYYQQMSTMQMANSNNNIAAPTSILQTESASQSESDSEMMSQGQTVTNALSSLISGGVYCLNTSLDIPPFGSNPPAMNPPPISNQLAQLLANLQAPMATQDQVVIGGQIGDGLQALNSVDNSLQGNVDFCNAQVSPTGVSVNTQNQWTGSSRYSVWTNRDLTRLGKLLAMPDPSAYALISPPELVSTGTANPENPSQTEPYLMLMNNLTIGTGGQSSGPPFTNNPKVRIDSSLGNVRLHYQAGSIPPVVTDYSGKTLEVDNCALYVNGDLVMGNNNQGPGSGSGPTTLKGSNATIIVNGTLCLSEAAIDAQSQGMVILCRYLICQSTGYFRGLVMVQNGAIFYPRSDPTLPPLELHGALVAGGTGTFPSTVTQNSDQQASMSQLNDVSNEMQQWAGQRISAVSSLTPGMTIWSSQLIYEPRYLPTLHGLGYSELLSLRRLP